MNDVSPRGDLKKADLTRRRILDAAARTFMEKGCAATRLSDIAEAAGLQAGSIYYHFDSKEEIIEAVLEIGIGAVAGAAREAVEKLGPAASWRARIEAAIEAHLRQLLSHGDYTAADIRNAGQLPEDIQMRHLRQRRDYGYYWRDLLEGAQAAGEIRPDCDLSVVRMLLLGAMNWTVEWYDRDKKPSLRIAEELSRMMFDGLGTAATATADGRAAAAPATAPALSD